MSQPVKSGKEILDDFFANLSNLDGVDKEICQVLSSLYEQEKFTDANVKNALQTLRNTNGTKN